jgi:hypothetical protein
VQHAVWPWPRHAVLTSCSGRHKDGGELVSSMADNLRALTDIHTELEQIGHSAHPRMSGSAPLLCRGMGEEQPRYRRGGRCRPPRRRQASTSPTGLVLRQVSPGKQEDRECHARRQPSRSKRPARARPGVVRDTGSLASVCHQTACPSLRRLRHGVASSGPLGRVGTHP